MRIIPATEFVDSLSEREQAKFFDMVTASVDDRIKNYLRHHKDDPNNYAVQDCFFVLKQSEGHIHFKVVVMYKLKKLTQTGFGYEMEVAATASEITIYESCREAEKHIELANRQN